jgi:hypothetical protein
MSHHEKSEQFDIEIGFTLSGQMADGGRQLELLPELA